MSASPKAELCPAQPATRRISAELRRTPAARGFAGSTRPELRRRVSWTRWVLTDGNSYAPPSPAERRALFKVRWSEATGLRGVPAFAPTANELRIYYRFLLAHPDRARRVESDLRHVTAVEKLDLEYPGLFARGVIHYRGGQWATAAQLFRAHLAKHPRGPWSLRAQNHLLAAAERTRETTPEP